MKRPLLNPTFFKFLTGFVVIIGVAFGVMYVASVAVPVPPVDIVAQPQ